MARKPFEHRHAIHFGHDEIENHRRDRGRIGPHETRERRFAVCDPLDRVTLAF